MGIFKKACACYQRGPAALGVAMCPESFDTSRCIIKTPPRRSLASRSNARRRFLPLFLSNRPQIPQRRAESSQDGTGRIFPRFPGESCDFQQACVILAAGNRLGMANGVCESVSVCVSVCDYVC